MTTQFLPEILPPIKVAEVSGEQPDMLELLQRPCGCCAAKKTESELLAAPFWDDKQHLRLLRGALRVLDRIPNNEHWAALFPAARRLCNLMRTVTHPDGDPSGPFYDAVCQGLYDADYKDEYVGKVGMYQIWYMHFYDSLTGHSFYRGYENARTEGEKYFNQSLFTCPETATPEQLRRIGYLFGLSLHYLTDLTQPMHAVNFTNVLAYREYGGIPDPFEWRHARFEKYADSDKFAVAPGDYTVAQLDPAQWGGASGAGRVLHEVSACSRQQYDYRGLRKLVDSKWPWDGFGSEADPYILDSLSHGFFHTAMFLLYFGQRSPRG